jgi:lipopolysaccharide transport system ATP-binding protein
MSRNAIEVSNLSKQYRLGVIGTGALSHDINRWWHLVRGKEDPYLTIGETNDRTKAGSSQYVWSLKDMNFNIKQGDAVGIIGRNGAGKSTLLKVLSRVTAPTTGSVKIKGKVASLLEVGTGFHPELSGRENVFLNGTILGMRKHEIKKYFDAIVDFAGVERYIDTPVKRYSSGMYVRLAFAVAAHLQSEILIVDEVLAVGDSEFQKKCLGKMGEVSKGEGRTVLFVSHNMAAVSNLCNTSILLNQGRVEDQGDTRYIIDKYITTGNINQAEVSGDTLKVTRPCPDAEFVAVRIKSHVNGLTTSFGIDEEVLIEMDFRVTKNGAILYPSIHLLDNQGTCILATANYPSASIGLDPLYGKPLETGVYRTTCVIPASFLNDLNYSISAFLVPKDFREIGIAEQVITFGVTDTGEMRKEYSGNWIGLIRPKLSWNTTRVS